MHRFLPQWGAWFQDLIIPFCIRPLRPLGRPYSSVQYVRRGIGNGLTLIRALPGTMHTLSASTGLAVIQSLTSREVQRLYYWSRGLEASCRPTTFHCNLPRCFLKT